MPTPPAFTFVRTFSPAAVAAVVSPPLWVRRAAPLQPQDRPCLPSQGSLSATVGIQFARLGRQVPRRVAPPDHAIPHRTHEENRPFATQSSRTHPELFPSSKVTFQRRRGGFEQQGQSHHEKIVRLSHLPRPRTRPLSLTWQAARPGVHPRFLLTSLLYRPRRLDWMSRSSSAAGRCKC